METAQSKRHLSPSKRRLGNGWLARGILSIAIAVLLLATLRKSNSDAGRAGQGSSPAEPNRQTVEVRRGTIKKKLIISGELRAVRSHTIFAQTSDETKITYLPPEGTVVKA